MPRLHALELIPDDAGRDAVLSDWRALRDAGLPSQLDHRGETNTPHVTVIATPRISAGDARRATQLLVPLLPVPVWAAGLAVFGRDLVTLVRVVDVADEVTAAVLQLRAVVPGHQHPGWLPHLTLARRLPRADVQRAVDVLGHADVELDLVELRRWDPDAGEVTRLARR